MNEGEREARVREAADWLDRYIAGKPELLTTPAGFVAGILISVAQQAPGAILRALAFAERVQPVLTEYVEGGRPLEDVIAAFGEDTVP